MSRSLILLAGTERLRLYTCDPGEPVPLFLPGFDSEEPLAVVAGETPDLLGKAQDDKAQAFLLDHLVLPALPAEGPAMLERFFAHLHEGLRRAGYLDRALRSLVVVPPPLADPERCATMAATLAEVFGLPTRCCTHRKALAAGLWSSGAIRTPSSDHPTWVQVAAAHHTLLMRLRSDPDPTLELVARLDQGGRSVDQRLARSLSEALGRSPQSAQAAVVVLAARAAKELLCGGGQRHTGPLEHWVSLQLDGEYWEGGFTTDLQRFEAPGSAGPALDRMASFIERAYRQLGLTPLGLERPRPQLVVCGRGNLLPGLRRLRQRLPPEEPASGVHLAELLDDAGLLARGAALAEGLCRLDGGYEDWPPPPPPPVEIEVEPVLIEPPGVVEPVIIDVDPEEPDPELEVEERSAEPGPPAHTVPPEDQDDPLGDIATKARRTFNQFCDAFGGYAPTSKPPPGRCPKCQSRDLEWVFWCQSCGAIVVAEVGQAPIPCGTCRHTTKLIRRCTSCGSYC
jgi:hypothetical protein